MPDKEADEIALEFEDTQDNLKSLAAKANEIRLDGEEKPFDISDIDEKVDDDFLSTLDNEEPEEEVEEEKDETEKEEVEDVKKEEEEVTKDVKEETKEDLAVKELLTYLKDGGTTKIKVKGVEKDLTDLTAEEIRVRLQKGDRFYDEMENLAVRRREMDAEQEQINQGSQQVSQLMARYGGTGEKAESSVNLPAELKVNEAFDSSETKALKGVIATLVTKVGTLEGGLTRQSSEAQSTALIGEIETLKDEFPCLSAEQVIAMKAVAEMQGKNIPTRDIAEVCHRHYSGDKFFDSVLKARPDKLRELNETAVKNYLAKKGKAGKVGRSPSSSTASTKASSTKKTFEVKNFDDIEAQTPKLKKMLRELAEKGEEG